MIETKLLEVRDSGTFIPVAATRMRCQAGGPCDEAEFYLLRRSGFALDAGQVLVARLVNAEAHTDPYDWLNRTMRVAHEYIERSWTTLKPGDVVDVEFILGQRTQPKISERYAC